MAAAVEGYIRGRPDSEWWLDQIKAGEDFRKKVTQEEKWKTWRSYYRGDWAPGIMPVNLFFTLIRTIVPRIYFRNPSVSISPGAPGLESLIFSKVLERVDNKVIRQMKMKNTAKKAIHDTAMFGTGILKMGFGGFYNPAAVQTEPPLDERNNRVEYFAHAKDRMPWVSKVSPGKFIVPAGLEDFDHARWVAEGPIYRSIEDVRNDPRFENTKELKSSEYIETGAGRLQRKIKKAKLYEIHDTKTGKVFVLAPDHGKKDKVILFADDAMMAYGNGRMPYFPIQFNYDDEYFWGVPDSKILEPYQLDINEARTQIVQHRRLTLIKILAKRKAVSPEDAERMISEDPMAVVWVDGDGPLSENISATQGGTIPPEIYRAIEEDKGDVRETVGFSRNEFAQSTGGQKSHSQTTAAEAQIVERAANIRIDERRDEMADVLTDIVKTMHPMIFENWGSEQVIDIVGPGGIPIWIEMGKAALQSGQFNLMIDPESAIPETREVRERRALQLYEMLKMNPLIDPVKLTQFLLYELKGSQFDDMMRMLPAPQGGPPGGAVNPGQAAQLIGQGFKQLQGGGG